MSYVFLMGQDQKYETNRSGEYTGQSAAQSSPYKVQVGDSAVTLSSVPDLLCDSMGRSLSCPDSLNLPVCGMGIETPLPGLPWRPNLKASLISGKGGGYRGFQRALW